MQTLAKSLKDRKTMKYEIKKKDKNTLDRFV